ncbi:MAG: dependent oxidoreductase [Crocinitomicaceae bacterium]|jgi:glycine/D-amino acid oxidase-like deaminating enzyme|nr:dependent oxidoreductase [Crocinitomicaceae bacterium]
MLKLNALSYWERNSYFEGLDFVIVGAGIVGCSTAIHLRKKYPDAKILILERGYLPMGASTKNAGFACFGSVTELCDDLKKMPEPEVWLTVQKRYEGLIYLQELIGRENLDFQQNGSWDLIDGKTDPAPYRGQLDYLNEQIGELTGEMNVYSEDLGVQQRFGFGDVKTGFYNRLEAQIDTGKMMLRFAALLSEHKILHLSGIEVIDLVQQNGSVQVQTSVGEFKASNACICVNGFAKRFLPNDDIQPARAQVLITKPIENLHIKGTFHYQMGYYYFRNIHNRILFGGARNLAFEAETTETLENTELITNELKSKLKTMILPGTPFEVDYTWAGIMGVGQTKKPIIRKISDNIAIGVRMGGMGVAIGSMVGKENAELF